MRRQRAERLRSVPRHDLPHSDGIGAGVSRGDSASRAINRAHTDLFRVQVLPPLVWVEGDQDGAGERVAEPFVEAVAKGIQKRLLRVVVEGEHVVHERAALHLEDDG